MLNIFARMGKEEKLSFYLPGTLLQVGNDTTPFSPFFLDLPAE